MASHGAIDCETKDYVIPDKAQKGREYKCADCDQRVIFRKGDVRIHHFAHFNPNTKCRFYIGSGESENHKHAKLLLSKWLKEKKPINFMWSCSNQFNYGRCGTYDGSTDHNVEYKDGDEVIVEYRDPMKKYVADVALLNGGKVRYIFEVKHSHCTTTTTRPEPWFEINCNEISEGSHYGEDVIYLENCRINENRYCSGCTVKKEAWTLDIPILKKKHGVERKWLQDEPCMVCDRCRYNPEWIGGSPRQVCKICLSEKPLEVREVAKKIKEDKIKAIFPD
jgi:hypothetical protein